MTNRITPAEKTKIVKSIRYYYNKLSATYERRMPKKLNTRKIINMYKLLDELHRIKAAYAYRLISLSNQSEKRRKYLREAAKKYRQRHPDAYKKWLEKYPTYANYWRRHRDRQNYFYKCIICSKTLTNKARHEKTKLHKTNILKMGNIEPNNIYCSMMKPLRNR